MTQCGSRAYVHERSRRIVECALHGGGDVCGRVRLGAPRVRRGSERVAALEREVEAPLVVALDEPSRETSVTCKGREEERGSGALEEGGVHELVGPVAQAHECGGVSCGGDLDDGVVEVQNERIQRGQVVRRRHHAHAELEVRVAERRRRLLLVLREGRRAREGEELRALLGHVDDE